MALASRDLDGFLPLVNVSDTKKRLCVGTDLLNYLLDPSSSVECQDIGQFIDALVPWINSSNFKVSQNGLDIMCQLADKMGPDFRAYIPTVLPSIIDRLGDSKDMVRERCQLLILKLMEKDALSPQFLFDKLIPSFTHKNTNVREEVLSCLVSTLDEHGAQSLTLSKLVPHVIKLLSDPSSSVRDSALNTMATIYRHVGDKLRMNLQRKYNVPAAKLPMLLQKFDEIKNSGDMLPTAVSIEPGNPFEDTVDDVGQAGSIATAAVRWKRTPGISSSQAQRRNVNTGKAVSGATPVPTSAPLSTYKTTLSRTSSTRKNSANTGVAGAIDEEWFLKAFEDVPTVQLFSAREVDDHMTKIRETISDVNQDWNKRVDALKKLRSLMIAGAPNFDEFPPQLRLLEPPFQLSVKDLRSQVVREACITIAFLSQTLGIKFDHFAECILPQLLNLIMNSAKVIASAGLVAVRFILQHTHSPRLIPVIISHLSSKSKDIRRACCEFLDQIVHTWHTHPLERHIALLQDGIKKGICDADSDARLSARKAYWGFKDHFPEQAETLLKNLDPSYKRALNGEMGGALSNSSSNNSLNMHARSQMTTPRPYRPLTDSGVGSATTPRRANVPVSSVRSNSAIDLQAAQRAKVRAQYAALARQKVGSGASLPRARKLISDSGSGVQGPPGATPVAGLERTGRTRSRVSGVSQSQPSSRSGSPSSRLNYTTYSGNYSSIDGPSSLAMPRSRRSSSGIPRSTGASRETSPSRYSSTTLHSFNSKLRGRVLPGVNDRPPMQSRPPVMAQRILQQSLEAESALADALNLEPSESGDATVRISGRRSSCRPFEDHSDDSETSSVCSERSFDSFRKHSDSYSWSGSQQRLYREIWEPTTKDINEIIANCESTHWSDRKEGLVGLQAYLQAGNVLTPTELKRVTDNFTKMFMDSHTKVFSLFLDTLNDLIISHRTDLNSWLYVLLTRLLNKLGADLLGSIQTKIHKSLDVVRTSFPSEIQMSTVLRFLCDATQTPNVRVKTAACNYITKLAAETDPGLAFHPPSPGQAKDTATAALGKMIGWTMGDSIKQGSELRRAAQDAILALFNLNTPQVTLRFAQLPKEYQEAAASLIQGRVRRNSSSTSTGNNNNVVGGGGIGGVGVVSSTSPPASPASPTSTSLYSQTQSPRLISSHIDAENLNPEEVYRSLRRTTAEIQNYSFESGGKLDREATSQDSGISQMSAGAGDSRIESLEQRMEDLSISRNHTNRAQTGRVLTVRDCNGIDTPENGNQMEVDSFSIGGQGTTAGNNVEESEAVRKVVDSLKSPGDGEEPNSQNCTTPLTEQEKKAALNQLIRLIRDSSCTAIADHFKSLLRVLLFHLASGEPSVRALVLASLTEMMKRRALTESFNKYVELLVLKVLQSFRDGTKEVQRSADNCAATIATQLAPELVIRVLIPLISTGEYPVNLAAVKTLTKLVETRGSDPVQSYLADLMPGLIQAYDNEESSVRKSAVFCMVALHSSVGEEHLKPHLGSLNGSKLKLLHLYIRRAQQGSSVPTSPKNQPSS